MRNDEHCYFIGGVAGLLLCLFAKFQKYRDNNCCTENVLVEVNERSLILEWLHI